MDRLTEWNKEHTHGSLIKGDGYTKLAEYEDTRLTPEEVKDHVELYTAEILRLKTENQRWERDSKKYCAALGEIKIAEAQGLYIKLPPCKIGEFLYCIDDGEIYEYYVDSIAYMGNGKYCIANNEYTFVDFGKIAFTTREEAEKAICL